MRKLTYAVLIIGISAISSQAANLIVNGGLEAEGSTTYMAENWEWGNPDTHGSTWGTSTRESWRSYKGSYEATIRGTWAGGDCGGWWQEAQASPGVTYTASAWFWNDESGGNGWTCSVQKIMLEFYDDEVNILTAKTNIFSNVGETWTKVAVQGVAPEDTSWARVVIVAEGVGPYGALQFDDVVLNAEPGTVILISQVPVVMAGLLCLIPVIRRRRSS